MGNLSRLLSPKSIAVVGGGTWCESIITAAQQIGFNGKILPVHPSGKIIAGLQSVPTLADIPGPIDAAFIGVNRFATLEVVAQLRELGAGGATCFASGFSEAAAEDCAGSDLQAQLVQAAGNMPILGPNCYGFLNALDGAGIWPDQHGCRAVDRGVAILTQSSNIAINLTMQRRGLPIGYVVACGNQAQTSQTDIAMHLLDDPRVTAIGLHIEGFGDLRGWEVLSQKARSKNVPLIALKSGKSELAQAAAISHTASLSGQDAAAQAFLDRIGIRRVENLPVFLEALKLAHMFGELDQNTLASVSCSGGEAALVADACHDLDLEFPPLNDRQQTALSAALGPMVALANPLDYHTYVWRDQAAMTAAWAAISDPGIGITLLISDYPRDDICDPSDWDIATAAAIDAAQQTGRRYAVVASLPELMPEATAQHLMRHGVAAMNGLDHTLAALDVMTRKLLVVEQPVLLPGKDDGAVLVSEHAAKKALHPHGVKIPPATVVRDRADAAKMARDVGFPVVLKVLGLAHKTGANGLALNLNSKAQVEGAIATLAPGDLLVEHMIQDPIAEVLVGVTRDPAHGFLLTLAAGGVMTEILQDSASLLVPSDRELVKAALMSLKMAPILNGYRGKPPVDLEALIDTVMAIQSYVVANASKLEEVEINPVICTKDSAFAVDALIRIAP